MTSEPCLLPHGGATFEHDEVGYAPNAITLSKFGKSVGIDFKHNGTPCHVMGNALDFRCCDPTRTTPMRPKIYQHRYWRFFDNFVKRSCIHFEWLAERLERGL